MRDRFRNCKVAHARLHDGRARDRIDVQDAIEFRERKQHSAAVRQRAARKSGASAARHDRHLHLEAHTCDARDLLFGFRQRDDHRQLPVHRQPVALVRPRVFLPPKHAVLGQECFQRGNDRALALDVNGAATFERDALGEQLRNVLLQQRCIHALKVSRARACSRVKRRKRSTAFFVSPIARIGYASPPSTRPRMR